MIRSFDELLAAVTVGEPVRLVGAAAQDTDTITAMYEAERAGLITPILVGDTTEMARVMEREGLEFRNAVFVRADTLEESAARAVELVRGGHGDFLMKGLLDTNIFLKAIVDRERGLPRGKVLSHVMTFDVGTRYHKILITSDGGMCLYPDLEQKAAILRNALTVARALGVEAPKCAVICAKEKVNPKMQPTVDAAELKRMAAEGAFGDAVVEGPISFDLAVSRHWAEVKRFDSPVAGDADVFLLPDIDAGNLLGKCCTALFGARAAGVIVGSSVPIVMTSRADDSATKLCSIALGCLMAQSGRQEVG